MSSKGDTSNKEEGEELSFMLQAMQQQFERMNVVFNEIRDWKDRQDVVIATLCEERPQRWRGSSFIEWWGQVCAKGRKAW